MNSKTTGNGLDPNQPRLNQELTQGTDLDPEQLRLKQETNNDQKQSDQTRQQLMVLNAFNSMPPKNEYGKLDEAFYQAIENPKNDNVIVPYLTNLFDKFQSPEDIIAYLHTQLQVQSSNPFPVNINSDGIIKQDKVDSIIRNIILSRMELTDDKFTSLFVPDPFNINYLIGGVDNKDKKFLKWKKDFQIKTGELVQVKFTVGNLIKHMGSIDSFLDDLKNLKGEEISSDDIRLRLRKINICHSYDLIYLVMKMMVSIRPKYFPQFKTLIYEMMIGLLWSENLNDKYKPLYTYIIEKLNSMITITPEEIAINYPLGIINPIISKSLQSKGSDVVLLNCQLVMIEEILRLLDSFTGSIESNNFTFKKVIAITAGLATGKSTITSLITAIILQKFNDRMVKDWVCTDKPVVKDWVCTDKPVVKDWVCTDKPVVNAETNKRGIAIFTIPSARSAAEFAVHSQGKASTYIIANGVIIPLHWSCPTINTGNRKRPIKVDHWADAETSNGLDTTKPLWEQMKQILQYSGGVHHKRKKYLPPTIIFADPKSTAVLLSQADIWKETFGYSFLSITDEIAATGDIELEKNPYMDSMADIIGNFPHHGMIISASLTERQLRQSTLFENYEMRFVSGGQSCNSWTQMFSHNNESLHPLEGIKSSCDYSRFFSDLSSTSLRCFPPLVVAHLKSIYEEVSGEQYDVLSYDDISSPAKYLDSTKGFLQTIMGLPEDQLLEICSTKVDVPIPILRHNGSTMTVTTTNPNGHILRLLKSNNEVPTPKKVEHLFISYENEIKKKIVSLEQDRGEMSNSGERDQQLGSSTDIKATIVDLKQQLKEKYNWSVIFSTSFGSTNVSRTWLDTYGHIDKKVFALLLSGLDLDFNDNYLDNAITLVKPTPKCVIVSPDQMYGRNIRTCQRVIIFGTGIGRETRDQAAARAGRDKTMDTAIVSLCIEPSILICHGPTAKRSIDTLQAVVDKHKITTKISSNTSHVARITSPVIEKRILTSVARNTSQAVEERILASVARNTSQVVEEVSVVPNTFSQSKMYGGDDDIERVQKQTAENLPLGPGEWQADVVEDILDDESNLKVNDSSDKKLPGKKLPGSQRKAERRKAERREAEKKKSDDLPGETKKCSSLKSMNKNAQEFVPSLLK